MEKNRYIDHTILKATATKEDVLKIVNEAKEYHFKSVCINPCFVKYASELLEGTDTVVCTVIGFPLGANTSTVKAFEAKEAIENGASEVDMVLNIGALKAHDYETVLNDIKMVREASKGAILKVILETCYLTKEEIEKASLLCVEAEADFVKTSTGFGTGGATVEDVKLMFDTVDGKASVKASGGIRSLEDFEKMVNAGATRIGASSGVEIMKGEASNSNY